MGEIIITNPDYNIWHILKLAGVDPIIPGKTYTFENGKLSVPGVSQETLENALANYDHEAWLRELSEFKKQQLRNLKIVADKNQIMSDGVDVATITIILEPTGTGIDVIDVLVDGLPVTEVKVINDVATFEFSATDPGKYMIEAISGQVRNYVFIKVV